MADETNGSKVSLLSIANYFLSNGPAWFLLAAVLYYGASGVPYIFDRIDKIEAKQSETVRDLTSELKGTNRTLSECSESLKKSHDRIEGTMVRIESAVEKITKGSKP